MNGDYHPLLVTSSILIAIFASYTALDLANSVTVAKGKGRVAWLAAGALAMGAGIWSMHFIGMLAFKMPGMAIAYHVPLLLLSVAVSMTASAIALYVVSRPVVAARELAVAALGMGAAIAGMHYIGIWSMRLPARIEWNSGLVLASLAIAVGASFVALRLAFRYRLDRSDGAGWIRAGGGIVMGFAIAGMHYTAMAAAHFVPRGAATAVEQEHVLATAGLAVAVAASTILILSIALAGSAVSRELSRRTGIAVSAAEARLQATIDSALDAIVTTDENSVIVDWNRPAAAMFGWSSGEAIGRSLQETIIPTRFRQQHQLGVQQYLATGVGPILNRQIEITALRKDGSEFPVELTVAPIRTDTGVLFTAFIRDITERKEAEHRERQLIREQSARTEAEDAERRIRSILESLADAFIAFGRDGRISYVNSKAEELLSAPRDALVGCDIWALHPELRDTPLYAGFQRALEERVPLDLDDYASRLWPGAWLHFHSAPTADGVAVYIRNVTAAKAAEEALRESEERFRQLAESVPEVFWMFTPDFSSTLYANPAYESVFGVPLESLYADPTSFVTLVHPEDAAQLHQAMSKVPVEPQTVMFRIRRPDGEMRTLRAHGMPVRNRKGEVYRVAGLTEDITEQQEVETRLQQAWEAAEAASRAKSDFLSRMSHELRTPLNAILGFGQLLELDLEKPDNRESVDQILRAGRHLLNLIDEVLEMARIESGRMSLSLEPVPVREIIQESVGMMRLAAAQNGVAVVGPETVPSDCFVLADRQRLKQVLLNLLSNAIRYNTVGGSVILECAATADERLRIAIADTGPGLSREKLGRLFTPFDRLGAEESGVSGTGLGLALSKGLVEAMGGQIGAESVEGEGSRFWLELAPATPHEGRALPSEPRPGLATERTQPARTILLVEDNLANVRLVERLFRRNRPGVRLLTAMQGRIGLDLAAEHRPDLVLLDVNLPDTPGDDVLRQIKANQALQDTPVVMVSGDATASQVQRLLELGAAAYITKPFDIQDLLKVVDDLLEARGDREFSR